MKFCLHYAHGGRADNAWRRISGDFFCFGRKKMPPPAETESGSVRKAIAVSAMQHDGGVERHFQVNPRKVERLPEGRFSRVVRAYAGEILLDPYSAHYEFQGEPEKVWIHNDGKTYFYGWGGNVYINAKNRFGGYVGKELYEYFIQGTYVRIWRVGFTPNIHYVYQ